MLVMGTSLETCLNGHQSATVNVKEAPSRVLKLIEVKARSSSGGSLLRLLLFWLEIFIRCYVSDQGHSRSNEVFAFVNWRVTH
jgi:hypothetical protein